MQNYIEHHIWHIKRDFFCFFGASLLNFSKKRQLWGYIQNAFFLFKVSLFFQDCTSNYLKFKNIYIGIFISFRDKNLWKNILTMPRITTLVDFYKFANGCEKHNLPAFKNYCFVKTLLTAYERWWSAHCSTASECLRVRKITDYIPTIFY